MLARSSIFVVLALAACGDNLNPNGSDGGPGSDADSGQPGTLSLTAASSTTESGTLVVVAKRTGGSGGTVSADYATSNGTATAGADYTETSGTLTWTDGDVADKSISIPLVDDLVVEGDETITVTLSDATGGATLGAAVTATITDDDRAGDAIALTSANRLISFDRTAPATLTNSVAITGLPNGTTLLGIDIRPATGVLYALSTAGTLFTIDKTTGAATLAATLIPDAADLTNPFTTLNGTSFGIDFNPVPDRLRIVSNTGQNLRVNVTTGATTTDTAITTGVAPTAAAYTNSFASACRTALYTIDPTTDRLLLQSPPNDGVSTAVGTGLGVNATAVRGFDTSSTTSSVSTAFAVLEVGGVTGLYTINITTGAATSVGAIPLAAGEELRGFALPTLDATTMVTQAPGELVGLTATQVLSYERSAPAKACTKAPLTGLASGDAPVGLDARPSTGLFYVLTNNAGAGKLYTLDAATGVASGAVAIATPLTGTAFGMDFNPTGPVALRIVSDTGQNLRVTDIATGATTADGMINGAATSVSGAAYTDSVAGAGATTLYVLDTSGAADRLLIQNPPNAGTTTAVGPLGVDLTNVVAFDIDGRDNTGFIAATTGAVTTLHTIDLATGTVSASLGTIAETPLIGLTRRTPTTNLYAVTAANNLVRVSLTDASTTAIGAITGLATGETIVGLDLRPSTGILYGVGSTNALYRIDPATGAATLASMLTADPSDVTAPFTALPAATELGVDFNPTGPVALRIVSANELIFRVADVTTGFTLTDSDLARTARTWSPVAIAYAGNVPSATSSTLFAIDNTNDKLLAITPPNNGLVREIGLLGIDPTASAVFEVVGPDTAIAVFDASNTKNFVTIDLTTGAATSVGNVGNVGGVLGIAALPSAVAPAANSLVYGISATGTLFTFARNAPAAVTEVGPIAGLAVGETIESFDIRPSTGELWILTRSLLGAGRLYTVSATTGAVTSVATLAADPADTTSPYSALSGLVRYSIDFNPAAAVPLRIFASDGSNLRLGDTTTGLVTTDTALTVNAPDVVAVAYTNSFRGATTTSLFGIDQGSSSLVQIDPPNNGTIVTVGALSSTASFTGAATFDIAGGNNGVALATLQTGVETFSRLYRINLTRGTATEIGAGVGGATGAVIRGMTIDIR